MTFIGEIIKEEKKKILVCLEFIGLFVVLECIQSRLMPQFYIQTTVGDIIFIVALFGLIGFRIADICFNLTKSHRVFSNILNLFYQLMGIIGLISISFLGLLLIFLAICPLVSSKFSAMAFLIIPMSFIAATLGLACLALIYIAVANKKHLIEVIKMLNSKENLWDMASQLLGSLFITEAIGTIMLYFFPALRGIPCRFILSLIGALFMMSCLLIRGFEILKKPNNKKILRVMNVFSLLINIASIFFVAFMVFVSVASTVGVFYSHLFSIGARIILILFFLILGVLNAYFTREFSQSFLRLIKQK